MKKLKLLLWNGSTNREGNTQEVLNFAAEELRKDGAEAELFWIGPEHVHECRFCRQCEDTGRCVIDDPVNGFLKKAAEADGFIFAVPAHRIASGRSVLNFFSRCMFAGRDILRLKPAAVITLARRSAESSGNDMLNKHILNCEMPLIASKYWNIGINAQSPKELFKNKENVRDVCTITADMVYYLQCREAGTEANIAKPERIRSAFELPNPTEGEND